MTRRTENKSSRSSSLTSNVCASTTRLSLSSSPVSTSLSMSFLPSPPLAFADVIHYSDTKLLSKSVVAPIATTAQKLYSTPQGRRSLLYLILPRSRRHFTPAQIALLAETDEIRSRTSKKDVKSREEEVRRAASEDLIAWVEKEGASLIKEPAGALVVAEVMLYAEGGLCHLILPNQSLC